MNDNELKSGLYYLLISKRVQALLEARKIGPRAVTGDCDETILADLIAKSVGEDIRAYLEEKLAERDQDTSIADVVKAVFDSEEFRESLDYAVPAREKRNAVLKEILAVDSAKPRERPDTEVNESALLVPDGISPQLGTEIAKELLSCDRADWLVSFIKLKAINAFYPTLRKFCEQPAPDGGPRLRLATTTYMGASDLKALKMLLELPNAEIRMSYDGDETRLHAKAYLFYRNSGFGTAYIGSANLSDQAMTTGLEWTAKLSQVQLPSMWERATSSFLKCWCDTEKFSPCTLADTDRIGKALERARQSDPEKPAAQFVLPDFDIVPHPYQQVVLDSIERERADGRHRHLVIAATGTGKTMVAAFDYARLCAPAKSRPTFLYIVHRKDILLQARNKYRAVLQDVDFGTLIPDDDYDSTQLRQVFCTPASWKSKIRGSFPKDAFQYIVVDECHHAAAASYDELIDYYGEVIDGGKCELLGLTATPEREDGKDIRALFGGSFTHELSLGDAITAGHLVPFSYFGLLDSTNVSYDRIDWSNRAEAEKQVQELLESNRVRAENVLREADRYIPDLRQMRALGFCAGVTHARLMAEIFSAHGVPAIALQGENDLDERDAAIRQLNSNGSNRINIIFTANLFNEGVDIPNVDTVLMLRPTDSATIFTQQLGRGLRLPQYGYKKDSLLVLDFVAPQNDQFNGALRFNVLTTRPDVPITKQVERGMPFLPAGCSVALVKGAQEAVLANIKAHIEKLKGKRFLTEMTKIIRNARHRLTLCELMERFNLEDPFKIYLESRHTPSELAEELFNDKAHDPHDTKASFMERVMQNDDLVLLRKWKALLKQDFTPAVSRDEKELRFSLATCWDYQHVRLSTVDEVWKAICKDPGLKQDLSEYLDWRIQNLLPRKAITFPQSGSLILHNRYSRTQVTAAFGADGDVPMAGVRAFNDRKAVAFFVTRYKSDRDFSPQTMYKDYAITPELFHWESQSNTKVDSQQGRRYINGEDGFTSMLFIQEHKQTEGNVPESFIFLGPLIYQSHEGECPISFIWKLATPMPAEVYQWAKA